MKPFKNEIFENKKIRFYSLTNENTIDICKDLNTNQFILIKNKTTYSFKKYENFDLFLSNAIENLKTYIYKEIEFDLIEEINILNIDLQLNNVLESLKGCSSYSESDNVKLSFFFDLINRLKINDVSELKIIFQKINNLKNI